MQRSSLSYSVVSPALKTTAATNLSAYMKWNQGIEFLGGNREMSGIINLNRAVSVCTTPQTYVVRLVLGRLGKAKGSNNSQEL